MAYTHNSLNYYDTTTIPRAPYVDPITSIVFDTNNADLEGWIYKQSTWIKKWRHRYCILKGSKLFYSKNEYIPPHGMIDLTQCSTVKSAELKSFKPHSFEISTPCTTFLFYSECETEKHDWIGTVGRAIVHCSKAYQSLQREEEELAERNDDLEGEEEYRNEYSNEKQYPYFN